MRKSASPAAAASRACVCVMSALWWSSHSAASIGAASSPPTMTPHSAPGVAKVAEPSKCAITRCIARIGTKTSSERARYKTIASANSPRPDARTFAQNTELFAGGFAAHSLAYSASKRAAQSAARSAREHGARSSSSSGRSRASRSSGERNSNVARPKHDDASS